MNNRPHWSYSAISQYLRCPLQFFFQRVLKLPRGSVSSSLVLGSAVHHSLAEYHRALQSNQPVQRENVTAAFLDSWRERQRSEDIQYQAGQAEEEIIAQGVGLIETYLKEPPPENIVAVESEMLAPIHNSDGEYLEKPLLTVIDLLTREGDGLRVNDFKTSGRAYSTFEAETSLQATCYVNAVAENFGEPATFQYTVLVKTKVPKVQRLDTVRGTDDLGRLGDLVQTVERAVESSIFYPVESPLNCSTCPYRQPCREWRGEPKEPVLIAELAMRNGANEC